MRPILIIMGNKFYLKLIGYQRQSHLQTPCQPRLVLNQIAAPDHSHVVTWNLIITPAKIS